MAAKWEIRWDASEIDAWRQELEARGGDLGQLTPAIQSWLESILHRNLQKQDGGPYGAWPALSADTLEKRRRGGFGSGPMLRNTGTLDAAIAGKHGKRGASAFVSGSGEGFYGNAHNKGDLLVGRGGVLPQRGFVFFRTDDVLNAEEFVFDSWLNGFGSASLPVAR